jgi:hypothetical protein
MLIPNHHPSMPEVSISEDGVKKLLKGLNAKKPLVLTKDPLGY